MELRPAGRFEWEQVVRRIVSLPEPSKYLAFVMASWADPDGSRVRPGERVLAAVIGKDQRTVRRRLDPLVAGGLLQLVSRGGGRGGRGRAAEYRLTLPTDLLDRHRLLGPDYDDPDDDQPASPDTQMSPQSPDSGDIQVSGESAPSPVDNSEPPDSEVSGQSPVDNSNDRTNNIVSDRLTGHLEPIDRTPRCPTTSHRPTTTNQPTDSPTDVTTDRAHETPLPSPRCHHGLDSGRAPDGTPRCPLCRRAAVQAAPPFPGIPMAVP